MPAFFVVVMIRVSYISVFVPTFDVIFKSLWRRMRYMVEVITIGDGLPGFLGASSSGSAFSTLVVSVSMSVVLIGVKKLRVMVAAGQLRM
jgi:hypothetical protein